MSTHITLSPRPVDGERLYFVDDEREAEVVRGLTGSAAVTEAQMQALEALGIDIDVESDDAAEARREARKRERASSSQGRGQGRPRSRRHPRTRDQRQSDSARRRRAPVHAHLPHLQRLGAARRQRGDADRCWLRRRQLDRGAAEVLRRRARALQLPLHRHHPPPLPTTLPVAAGCAKDCRRTPSSTPSTRIFCTRRARATRTCPTTTRSPGGPGCGTRRR